MLDTYIIGRLVQWAEWRARKDDGGLGFPKKCAFTVVRGGGHNAMDMVLYCTEMDQAVCALESERKDVVMQCYTQTGTKEQKARRCGISVNTYNLRLDMAHRDLLGLLNDIAAGVKV